MNDIDINSPDYLDEMEKFDKIWSEVKDFINRYHINIDKIFNSSKLLFEESNYYIDNIIDKSKVEKSIKISSVMEFLPKVLDYKE